MIEKFIKGRVAVFIDAANMLYSQQTIGWQIDYKRLIAYLKSIATITYAGFYYGKVKENKGQQRFFQMLKDRGYTLRTKPVKYIKTPHGLLLKGNLDVELTLDMSQKIQENDSFILFSGDSDFAPLVKLVKSFDKSVIVVSSRGHIARELIRKADTYIPLETLKRKLMRKGLKKSPRVRRGGGLF